MSSSVPETCTVFATSWITIALTRSMPAQRMRSSRCLLPVLGGF